MKKLILLLLFIPLVSFGQDEVTVIQSKTNISSSTNVENELVLSDEKTTIKTPLTADLSNYTHLLLVDILIIAIQNILWQQWCWYSVYQAGAYKEVKNYLGLSAFDSYEPIRS